jgi:hypothetical protein
MAAEFISAMERKVSFVSPVERRMLQLVLLSYQPTVIHCESTGLTPLDQQYRETCRTTYRRLRHTTFRQGEDVMRFTDSMLTRYTNAAGHHEHLIKLWSRGMHAIGQLQSPAVVFYFKAPMPVAFMDVPTIPLVSQLLYSMENGTGHSLNPFCFFTQVCSSAELHRQLVTLDVHDDALIVSLGDTFDDAWLYLFRTASYADSDLETAIKDALFLRHLRVA